MIGCLFRAACSRPIALIAAAAIAPTHMDAVNAAALHTAVVPKRPPALASRYSGRMQAAVLAVCEQLEIVDAVIVPDFVFVVNHKPWRDSSVMLHPDKVMLQRANSCNRVGSHYIPVAGASATSFPLRISGSVEPLTVWAAPPIGVPFLVSARFTRHRGTADRARLPVEGFHTTILSLSRPLFHTFEED